MVPAGNPPLAGPGDRALRLELALAVMGLETELGAAIETRDRFEPVDAVIASRLVELIAEQYSPGGACAESRGTRFFLPSGDCVYPDIGNHPELVTRECRTPRQVLAADMALRHAAAEAGAMLSANDGVSLTLFANSRDWGGTPYGCHENYLSWGTTSITGLTRALMPHLLTRIVFTGSGMIDLASPGGFQLSQRADSMRQITGSNRSHDADERPFVDTRNESLSGDARQCRIHVSSGEANLLQLPTYLKLGTTACLVAMIDQGWELPPRLHIDDPTLAFQTISRDLSLQGRIGPSKLRAIDVQFEILAEAKKWFAQGRLEPFGDASETRRVLRDWERVVAALDHDPESAVGLVDWVTRRAFLDEYASRQDLTADAPVLQALSLRLEELPRPGSVSDRFHRWRPVDCERVLDPERIDLTGATQVVGTRADVRANAIRQLHPIVVGANWSELRLALGDGEYSLPLTDPIDDSGSGLAQARTYEDALRAAARCMLAHCDTHIDEPQPFHERRSLVVGAGRILGRTPEVIAAVSKLQDRWPHEAERVSLRFESIPRRGMVGAVDRSITD